MQDHQKTGVCSTVDKPRMQARIPSLDGARAISICFVILSHLSNVLPPILRFDYGNLGVRVFFVISGFLITSLLVTERTRTGRIGLKNFYLRRFLRLMPAYWVYVAVIAALIPTGLVVAKWSDLVPVLGYFSNYRQPIGVLGHTWSLSVEEQFYFLWPAFLCLVPMRRALWGCAALILIAPVFRILSDSGHWPSESRYAWESVCDALAVGCALALLRESLWSRAWYQRLVGSAFVLAAPAIAVLLLALHLPDFARNSIALPLLNIGIALVLERYMRFPEAHLGRVLNSAPLVWVGLLSYSLYLWQQLFVFTELALAVKLAAILACAAASYYIIERPVFGLRSRFRNETRTAGELPARAASAQVAQVPET